MMAIILIVKIELKLLDIGYREIEVLKLMNN